MRVNQQFPNLSVPNNDGVLGQNDQTAENRRGATPRMYFEIEVDLPDIPTVSAEKISGFKKKQKTVEVDVGGQNKWKESLRGQTRCETILVERVVDKPWLCKWNDIKNEEGTKKARSNTVIRVKSGPNQPVQWAFRVKDAYPVQYDGPEMNAMDTKLTRETAELDHRGFKVVGI